MSQWRTTSYDAFLGREITTITLMPELSDTERLPFDAWLLLADETSEADGLVLRTALEAQLCKHRQEAAVCLPGWVLHTADPLRYLTHHVPTQFSGLFPLKVSHILGVGSARRWIAENREALSACYRIHDGAEEENGFISFDWQW